MRWVGDVADFIYNPTREKLFPIDYSYLDNQYCQFFKSLEQFSYMDVEQLFTTWKIVRIVHICENNMPNL